MIEPHAKKYKSFVVGFTDFEELIREHLGNDAADYFKEIAKELVARREDADRYAYYTGQGHDDD